jgi:aryl-alcohol dehydrogenase-like predicted oxidoreductase
MLHRRRVELELAPMIATHGIGLTTWSPLASGILTGKYNDGIPKGTRASMESMAWLQEHITAEKIEKVKLLEIIAKELDVTTAQLAIAWLLRRKEVSSVITGATSLKQLEENIAAQEIVKKLDDELLSRIETILDNDPTENE